MGVEKMVANHGPGLFASTCSAAFGGVLLPSSTTPESCSTWASSSTKSSCPNTILTGFRVKPGNNRLRIRPRHHGSVKITPDCEAWRVKARFVCLCLLPSYTKPSVYAAMEMVLMDEFGCKMQATVKKTLIYKFMPL